MVVHQAGAGRSDGNAVTDLGSGAGWAGRSRTADGAAGREKTD
ncbi:hypothetical protein [Streptomyces sp. SAS_270]